MPFLLNSPVQSHSCSPKNPTSRRIHLVVTSCSHVLVEFNQFKWYDTHLPPTAFLLHKHLIFECVSLPISSPCFLFKSTHLRVYITHHLTFIPYISKHFLHLKHQFFLAFCIFHEHCCALDD